MHIAYQHVLLYEALLAAERRACRILVAGIMIACRIACCHAVPQ